MDYKILADLLMPEVKHEPEYYEKLYPERRLSEGAMVTRYAPSPTGFQHLGGVFAAIIAERTAHQSGGVFYLRIEDTDKKREVEGGVRGIIKAMETYNIYFDEGMRDDVSWKGSYGPYKQSERGDIYKAYVKHLIVNGHAYPCFCSEEELSAVRKEQELNKERTGYHGRWAKCRNLTLEEIKENMNQGKDYIIRLKSEGNWDRKIIFKDLIKGKIELPENDQDIVILKSDGLPTYHFAHAVDDHLMRTTHVTRGEEWLPSTPIHLQLFELLGFKTPKFAHISPILKMEGTSKRKLSKRKDPELAFSYYDEQGYPSLSVIEYLLSIINSNFEGWRRENPGKSYMDFEVKLSGISPGGALFDISKLNDVSRSVIASMKAEEVCSLYMKWAEKYDCEMAELIKKDKDYAKRFFNIEREGPKPRKDYSKWSDVREYIEHFYDKTYNRNIQKAYNFQGKLLPKYVKEILEEYVKVYNPEDDKEAWFEKIKKMAGNLGFAENMKAYRKSPDDYRGNVADVASVIRIAVTNRVNTPDLYEIMQILGEDRVIERIEKAVRSI